MVFLPELLVGTLLAVAHTLISFNLKLPNKYQQIIRKYSVTVTLLFLLFLISFYLFVFRSPLSDQEIMLYSNGLSTFYFLLFTPLLIAMSFRFHTLIMTADIYSNGLKYVIIFGTILFLAGVVLIGYPLYIFFFYGFAP